LPPPCRYNMNNTNTIYIIMGKSSCGKDTIFRRLGARADLRLKTIVAYTTRPIRGDEENGREYFFMDAAGHEEMSLAGNIIEERVYATQHGPWHYFTAQDGQFDFRLNPSPRLMIGTLESYEKLRNHFDGCKVVPIMIELDDGMRLSRALAREMAQTQPKYEEMCRRFLADAADFAEAKIARAGIKHRFDNQDLDKCEAEVAEFISWT